MRSSGRPASRSALRSSDRVEPRAQVLDGPRGLGRRLVGHRRPQPVGRCPSGSAGIGDVEALRLPPGRSPAVAALAADGVAEDEADGPLPSPGVGVQQRVVERQQQAVEVPPSGRRRADEPARPDVPWRRRRTRRRAPRPRPARAPRRLGRRRTDLFLARRRSSPGRVRAASGMAIRSRAAAITSARAPTSAGWSGRASDASVNSRSGCVGRGRSSGESNRVTGAVWRAIRPGVASLPLDSAAWRRSGSPWHRRR